MNAYLHLTRAGLRAFFRDRQGVFWSFFFPLFFIFIFGTIFGKKKDEPQMRFKVGIVMQDPSPAAAWVPKAFQSGELSRILKTTVGNLPKEEAALKKGDSDGVVVFPANFGSNLFQQKPSDIRILVDPTQPQSSQMVAGMLRNILANMELGAMRRMMSARNPSAPDSPLFQVKQESVSASADRAKTAKLSGMDFLLPGILAMTVMQLGLFTAIPLINLREKGILKRLRATPLPRSTVIGGQVTQRLVIGVIQTLVILGVGLVVFHFHMLGSWPLLFALVVFGIFTFIGIGAVLASVAKTQESGVSLVQLVNFPMMFLSGLFIPLQILPDGLRSVVGVLPATHLASIMRHIMVDAPIAYSIPTSLGVMAAWLAGGLLLASRMFRWE
jgi:ABC-2 type transport system permease protein